MKILHLDIETSPNLGYIWGLWKQNIGLAQLVESTEILCWVAKWHGEDELMFKSLGNTTKEDMIKSMWKLLDETDAVCHYNGVRFDIPHLNREFLDHGLAPPSSYKQIDLLQAVKKQFRYPSNKLEYVAKQLGIGQKVKHIGFELWTRCMANDQEAWDMMEVYNRQDVVLLEELYNKFVPWIPNHPNFNLYVDNNKVACTKCGSGNYRRQGYAYTGVSKFQQYRCKDCGSWYRGRKNLAERGDMPTAISGI